MPPPFVSLPAVGFALTAEIWDSVSLLQPCHPRPPGFRWGSGNFQRRRSFSAPHRSAPARRDVGCRPGCRTRTWGEPTRAKRRHCHVNWVFAQPDAMGSGARQSGQLLGVGHVLLTHPVRISTRRHPRESQLWPECPSQGQIFSILHGSAPCD